MHKIVQFSYVLCAKVRYQDRAATLMSGNGAMAVSAVISLACSCIMLLSVMLVKSEEATKFHNYKSPDREGNGANDRSF